MYIFSLLCFNITSYKGAQFTKTNPLYVQANVAIKVDSGLERD